MLKVKIKKSWNKDNWYANRIGEVFFVDDQGPMFGYIGVKMKFYQVDNNIHEEEGKSLIFKKDCKEVI